MIDEEVVEQVKKLNQQGINISGIAKSLGLSRPTVYKVLTGEENDSRKENRKYPHLKRRIQRDRENSGQSTATSITSSLVESLRDELEADKLSFEIEKIRDAKSEWEERRSKEKKETAEQERLLKLEQIRLSEQERQKEELQRKARHKIQMAKAAATLGVEKILSPNLLSYVYQQIEHDFSKMKVEEIPLPELIIMAKGTRDRILSQPPFQKELQKDLSSYLFKTAMAMMKRDMERLYQEALKRGDTKLSYQKWIEQVASGYGAEDKQTLIKLLL